MNERKKQAKKELLTNTRTFAVLAISLLLINYGLSMTSLINFTQNEKIKWTLDLGLYTFLSNVIISLSKFLFLIFKLNCEVSILNKKEEFNEITIRDTQPENISLEINLEGKPRKLKHKLEIAFPHWLDTQVVSPPYLTYIESENKYLIDLNYFMTSKHNIKLTETLTFDVIKNSAEKNQKTVEPYIKLNWFMKFFLRFESKGISIKLR